MFGSRGWNLTLQGVRGCPVNTRITLIVDDIEVDVTRETNSKFCCSGGVNKLNRRQLQYLSSFETGDLGCVVSVCRRKIIVAITGPISPTWQTKAF